MSLSGALDLTFASRVCRQVGGECQIRSMDSRRDKKSEAACGGLANIQCRAP